MDPVLYQIILDYKTKGQYSPNISKKDKNEIRRKASKYVLEGVRMYSVPSSWSYYQTRGGVHPDKEELGLMEAEQVQEDREESESAEREEMEGRKDLEELGLMETAQAQEEKVDSKMVEREEMEGQKDLGADKEREQTAEVGKRKIKEKKKVVATNSCYYADIAIT
ncbi:hypothetical protein E1301_Tti023304 [Triplophysa tibetana]|uniref:Uncharacterized protein n=1 Tax=Triplophysa tibetana TaxID=1572043 RepID=A0A5A9PD77_9TELE|nr:hypothetical protein E1301_Tti023304 [Triplophysa tibetana]